MYVATETFIDPTDGDLIEAGKTFVSDRADVFQCSRIGSSGSSNGISAGRISACRRSLIASAK